MEKDVIYLVLGFIGTLASLAQWPMYAAAFSILDNFTGAIIFALSPLLFVILALIPYYFIKIATVFSENDSLAVLLPMYGRGWVFILGLILLYGYYKATHPVYRYVDIQSDKVDGEVTIAYFLNLGLNDAYLVFLGNG